MFKKNLQSILQLFFVLFTSFSIQARLIRFKQSTKDYTNAINNALRETGSAEFTAGKIYTFKGTITTPPNGISILQTLGNGERAQLKYTGNKRSSIILLNGVANFKNLIIDGGGDKLSSKFGFLINLNGQKKVRFENVFVRNTNGNGMGQNRGRYADGLYVDGCEFKDIRGGAVIFLIDRRTVKNGGVLVTEFENPVTIKNSMFRAGNFTAVRMDCGNDFFEERRNRLPEDGPGVRRFNESTNVKTTISGNTFELSQSWSIGMVQVNNVTITNNKITGGGTKNNTASIHIEQFCTDITINNNEFFQRKGPVIAVAATEGLKRHRENPIIIFDNKGGRLNTQSQGKNNCKQSTPLNPNRLDCKRDVHSYGPRRWSIYSNIFRSTTNNVPSAIQMTDGEDIEIGATADGREKNTYIGNFKNGKIILFEGDLGNKGVNIVDNVTKCEIKANGNVWFGGVRSNVKLNNKTFRGCNNRRNRKSLTEKRSEFTADSFTLHPNPATSSITITGSNNYSIKIYSILGNLVKSIEANTTTTVISVNNLISGIYLVKYIDANQNISMKQLIVK